jgi:hypothetical protein
MNSNYKIHILSKILLDMILSMETWAFAPFHHVLRTDLAHEDGLEFFVVLLFLMDQYHESTLNKPMTTSTPLL